ncbi:tetraspanin-18-like [Liolophura sinensis]|uniref:tetraspanin-18-like n=1 Tax=Liolophura sinensis TaxID=3198878 RepID=UPI0031598A8F
MADGCRKCMKISLLIFNLVFLVAGAAAIGLGAWVILKTSDVIELIDLETATIDMAEMLRRGAYALISVGVVILFLSLLGFIGACKESKCLLILYGVVVLVLVLIQLSAIILAVLFRDKIERELISFLNTTLVDHYEGHFDSKEPFSVLWDGYQISGECCGIVNQDDFLYTKKWNRSFPLPNSVIPFTCCQFLDTSVYPNEPDSLQPKSFNCTVSPDENNAWLNKGCFDTLKSEFGTAANYIIIGGAVVLTIQLIGAILAFGLTRAVHNSHKIV